MKLKIKTFERIKNDPKLVIENKRKYVRNHGEPYGGCWIDLRQLQTGRHYICFKLDNYDGYDYQLDNGWSLTHQHIEEIIP